MSDGPWGWIKDLDEVIERQTSRLPTPLKAFVQALVFLVILSVLVFWILFALDSFKGKENTVLAVIAVAVVLGILLMRFGPNNRRALEPPATADAAPPPSPPAANTTVVSATPLDSIKAWLQSAGRWLGRSYRIVSVGGAALALLGGVLFLWSPFQEFANAQRIKYFPPDNLAYLKETLAQIESGEISDLHLRSLVDELFVVGPAAPVFSDKVSYNDTAALDALRLDNARVEDDVGMRIVSSMQIGGLFFRPSSFAIIETGETEPQVRGRRPQRVERAVGLRFSTKKHVSDWIARLQRRRTETDNADDGQKTPLLVMVDHEGGVGGALNQFDRLGTDFVRELPAAMGLSTTRQRAFACRAGFFAGQDLSNLGINVNLGPVLDIAAEDYNQVVHDRSFSTDLSTASAMSTAYMQGLELGGATGVIKHFPGHSRTPAGAHGPRLKTSDYDAAVLDALLEPFRSALRPDASNQAQFVMSAFFTAPRLGLEERENIATSPKFMHELLRGQEHPDRRYQSGQLNKQSGVVRISDYEIKTLNFSGVLISDDLLIDSLVFSEGGVKSITPEELVVGVRNQTIALFEAGHDMLLIADVRLQRDSEVKHIIPRSAAERSSDPRLEAPFLTLQELVSVRDALVDYIFQEGETNRRKRLRDSLARVFRQKIHMLESDLLRSKSKPLVPADAERSKANDLYTDMWLSSFGYTFRPGFKFPTVADAAKTIIVQPFGRHEGKPKQAGERLQRAAALNWFTDDGEGAARKQRYLRTSPIGVELMERLGPEVRVLSTRTFAEHNGCLDAKSAAGNAPSPQATATTPEEVSAVAGTPAQSAGAETGDNAGPTSSTSIDYVERSYEDLTEEKKVVQRIRRACFEAEAEPLAQSILSSGAENVIFVVTDQRSYFETLFVLTALQATFEETLSAKPPPVEHTKTKVEQPEEEPMSPWLAKSLVIFDWENLLTYSENEFGGRESVIIRGDADVLKHVNLFFPFSGYQTRARYAVEFLTRSTSVPLMRMGSRKRMPLSTPASDVPFSLEDAYTGQACRDVLKTDGLVH